MGCNFGSPHFSPTRSKEKISYYEEYINKSKIPYMEKNSIFMDPDDIENNPKAWNSFVIEKLMDLDRRNQWQSYTNELIKLLQEKPLVHYIRPLNIKSWLVFMGKKIWMIMKLKIRFF